MLFDAIVLAGGRSSRLGGEPKSDLEFKGISLLEHTLAAASGARRIVVVGPAGRLPPEILHTRESPAYAGPAAAIAAGLRALDSPRHTVAPTILVLACDMPRVAAAVSALLDARDPTPNGRGGAAPVDPAPVDPAAVVSAPAGSGRDGLLALDAGRLQYLVALYDAAALHSAIALNSDNLVNLSVRSLVSSLDLGSVAVADRSTSDIDTRSDAAAFGIVTRGDSAKPIDPATAAAEASTSTSESDTMAKLDDAAAPHDAQAAPTAEDARMETLLDWATQLSAELGLADAPVDIDAILSLAGIAAHAVLRPAAPLTTYIVGYSAGLAAAAGVVSPADAFTSAAESATALAAAWAEPAGAAK